MNTVSGIEIGTSAQGTVGNAAGAAAASLLSERGALPARVRPTSGQTVLLPLVNDGELELGIANVLEVAEAVQGESAFAGRRQSNIRVVCAIFPLRTGFFVRARSDIRSIGDLKGKNVTHGFSAMTSMRTLVNAILANGGLTLKDVNPIAVANANAGIEDLVGGKVDAFYASPGAGKVAEADIAVGGLRFLSLSTDPKAIAAMKQVFPLGFALETGPRPGFTGICEPVQALAYELLLLVGSQVTEDVVYRIARTLAENQTYLAAACSEYSDFALEKMAVPVPCDYHSGAIRYYEERGFWPSQEKAGRISCPQAS